MADSARTNLFLHRLWQSLNGGHYFNVAFIFSQEVRASASHHAIMAFIVPALLNFVQLKYDGKDDSPFETHPYTMCVAVTSLLMYCLAYDAELRFSSSNPTPTYARAVRQRMSHPRSIMLFGWLSVASLASILFPDYIRPILYLLYIVFAAGGLLSF